MTTLYPAVTSNGVVTSFVPLATLFTPSAECSGYFRLDGPSLVAFDPGYGLDIDTDVRCLPSAVTTWWEQGRLGGNGEDHTAISLGPLVCPYKWQTVATSIENELSTLAMCCPSGYYLGNGIPGSVAGDCLSDISSGARLTYASTSADTSNVWHTKTTSLTRSSTVGAIAVVGWNIKKTTPTETETTSSSSTTLPSPTSIPNSISVSSSSPSPSPLSNSSSQISTGTTVGIGVGVGLGVIGVAALLVIIYLMKRRKRIKLMEAPQVHNHQEHAIMLRQHPPEDLHEEEPAKHELHDRRTGRHELQGVSQSPSPPAELHE